MDIVAWLALAISALSLGWQVLDKFFSRPKLVATAVASSVASIDGVMTRNRVVAAITVHAVNGPVGIRDIEFALDPLPASGWGCERLDIPGVPPTIDLALDHAPVESGATVTWRYHFHEGNGPLSQQTLVTPTIVLTTGRRVTVQPVAIGPDIVVENQAL